MDFNKAAMENMAKAGALDAFGYNRRTVFENIGKLQKEIRKERKTRDPNQLTLFDPGFLTEAPASMELKPCAGYSFLEKCRAEKEATGLYISGHPAEAIRDVIKAHGGTDIMDLPSAVQARFGGVITEAIQKYTKKGAPMMILNVEDVTGSVKVLLFEKTRDCWPEIHEDGLVFITGTFKGGEDGGCVFLDTVCSLHEKPRKLWIGTEEASLVNLRKKAELLRKLSPGIGDLLYIASKKTKEREITGEIFVTDELIARAKVMFGEHNVAVTG